VFEAWYQRRSANRIRRLLCLAIALALWPASILAQPRPLMLAEVWSPQDPSPYFVSEKLDGVRGYWDGHQLWTRGQQAIHPPPGFTDGWPALAMDGELWAGRGTFEKASAAVRSSAANPADWADIRLMVFDLPDEPGPFSHRVAVMQQIIDGHSPTLAMIPQRRISSLDALDAWLNDVVSNGGEGLVLHRADAPYRGIRSDDLLKYKPFQDAEAKVIAQLPGQGRLQGKLGALRVRTPEGREFSIGTGFSDAEREQPPPVGSTVTYRYRGLTATGLPRFASFLRVRDDEPAPTGAEGPAQGPGQKPGQKS